MVSMQGGIRQVSGNDVSERGVPLRALRDGGLEGDLERGRSIRHGHRYLAALPTSEGLPGVPELHPGAGGLPANQRTRNHSLQPQPLPE